MDPWSAPEPYEDDDFIAMRRWLPPARAAAFDPTARSARASGDGGALLLRVSWPAVSDILGALGPLFQDPVRGLRRRSDLRVATE